MLVEFLLVAVVVNAHTDVWCELPPRDNPAPSDRGGLHNRYAGPAEDKTIQLYQKLISQRRSSLQFEPKDLSRVC